MYKTSYLNEEVNGTEASPSVVFTHTVKKLAEYLQGINTKGKDQYN